MDVYVAQIVIFVMTHIVLFVPTLKKEAVLHVKPVQLSVQEEMQENVFALSKTSREIPTLEKVMKQNAVQQDAELVAMKNSSATVQPVKMIITPSQILQALAW
jgi:hypothetical protein